MKKLKLFLILLFLSFFNLQSKTYTNKTFLLPRPAGVNLPMQMTGWNTFVNKELKNRVGFYYQTTAFYQQSTNGSEVGKYFGFNKKKELKVAINNGDVHPYNFNLRDDFESKISFHPKQTVSGQRIDFYTDWSKVIKGIYYSISMPIVKVENDPEFCEDVLVESAKNREHPGPYTVKEALRGDRLTTDWAERFEYSKIEGKRNKNGIADVDLKLGYKFFDKTDFKLSANLGLTIPSGNKPEGVYFWEPIVGNGGNWAVGAGADTIIDLWSNNDKSKKLDFIIVANYRYLLRNNQIRTLEFKHKNWGRFIRMRRIDPMDDESVLGDSYPGVNVMTRRIKVTPGSQLDLMADLSFKFKSFSFELGYNLWAHEEEHLKLEKNWNYRGKFAFDSSNDAFNRPLKINQLTGLEPTYLENAFAPGSGIFNGAIGQIFPAALRQEPISTGISSDTTIQKYAEGNGKIIESKDIDLSGTPQAISHKVFCAANYNINFKNNPVFLGVGLSFEFAQDNSALQEWAGWAKLGVAF